MEIVISITIQERQQHTAHTYKICENFILVYEVIYNNKTLQSKILE
jgi:hypothetical protein